MRSILGAVLSIYVVFLHFIPLAECEGSGILEQYDVVWDAPSGDFSGSMPIGNGDIGINLWTELNGDLLFYISKTDAWSENGRLLKLGRIRLALSPNPFVEGAPFEQTLRLRQGEIAITAGGGEQRISLRIWIDANRPVIRVEAESPSPFGLTVALEVWRNRQRELKEQELVSAYGLHGAPFPVYVYPDTICEDQNNQIVWYHRNQHSIWENNLKHQGMESLIERSTDPLMNLTFGGCIEGTGLESETPLRLSSIQLREDYTVSIYPLCAQTDTAEVWLSQLKENVTRHAVGNLEDDLAKHRAWWDEFWDRSWILVRGSADAETVTRGYVLQRFITACAGRGRDAVKFNGTIFTVDGEGFDADYRRWGGPYWWQNTRLPYWPMLASGDFDLMQPLFNMYREMTPLAEYRTKVWFGHGGAFIGETVYFWGMYNNENYGWTRDADLPVGEMSNHYIRREYTASLELLAMMIDYYQYIGDDQFLNDTLLPMSDSLLEFWDKHYQTDDDGTMRMYPAQALETLQDAENPTPDIAGLKWVLSQLMAIDKEKTGAERHSFWERLLAKVPPLPTADIDDGKIILGAEKTYGGRGNSENPELYAVFPFRLYGIGKPGLDIGRRTFEKRTVKDNKGWRQDETQAAYLGLTKVAQEYLADRAKTKHAESRFPAFWGPNFDWIPDQDHGGNLMKALQTMLMQTEGRKIILFSAWPTEWDVEFKLHAPLNTIVEGVYRDGKVS
ncbi:MAG: DUF5703 domain-containing protein, partial [bacterium]